MLSDKIIMFSARPGRVLTTIDVDLPRPRWDDDEEIKASDKFVEYRNDILHLLKHELTEAMADDA